MKGPDGGPAYPGQVTFQHPNGYTSWTSACYESGPGMSLRDYFAGQALATAFSIWDSGYAGDGGLPHDMAGAEHMAATAYQIADAMIAAREAE